MNMTPSELMQWQKTAIEYNKLVKDSVKKPEGNSNTVFQSLKDLGLEELHRQYREDMKNNG